MTTQQKRKILTRISTIQSDIETLRQVLVDLASSEYVSATLASGGGSKSYTRRGIGDVKEAIEVLTSELKSLRSMLSTNTALPINTIVTVYS